MASKNKEGSFNHLVAEISSDERAVLLEKIKAMSGSIENQTLESPFEINNLSSKTLEEEYREEFFIYKLWVWLRSVFKGVQPEQLYENDKISALAQEVNQISPGFIDFYHRSLTTLFYDHLTQLKTCADFFSPYFKKLQGRTGAFYIYLGSLLLPDVTSRINTTADPFLTPPMPTVTKEHRSALIRRIDDALKEIPPISRNNMYKAVVSIEWLKQFCNLPYNEFLSSFVNIVSDTYICSFDRINNGFEDFVRILSAGKTVTAEALEALFLFTADKSEKDNLNEFLNTAQTYLTIMHGFITLIPLVLIARIIFRDYAWQSQSFGGAEDWFVKYKAEWKTNFDSRWELWMFECKKEAQREILKNHFGLDSFPLMSCRPWSEIWGGLKFSYELTGGFICWYCEKHFSEDMKLLRFLQINGEFEKSENKELLTKTLFEFDQVFTREAKLIKDLGMTGEYGEIFNRLSNERMRTLVGQQKIDSLIALSEQTVKDLKIILCSSMRMLIMILKGIFKETTDENFGSIDNINVIGEKNHSNYVANLKSLIRKFNDILEIISGIELLENEKIK